MICDKKNILITRAQQNLKSAESVLLPSKFTLHSMPAIDFVDSSPTPVLDSAVREIKDCDYVIFTSQVAVTKTINYLRKLHLNTSVFDGLCVCAVGPCTAHLLRSYGITAQIIPENFTAISLLKFFPAAYFSTPKVLYPRSDISSTFLIEMLNKKGYEVISPVLYQTKFIAQMPPQLKNLIESGSADCLAFTSPSSVTSVIAMLGIETFQDQLTNSTIAAIGPTTAQACAKASIDVSIVAKQYTLQSLSREIAHFFNAK